MEILKKDVTDSSAAKQFVLPGVIFALEKQTADNTFAAYPTQGENSIITNSEGKILFDNLTPGIYRLKEEQPLPEYKHIDPIEFELSEEGTYQLRGADSAVKENSLAHVLPSLTIGNEKTSAQRDLYIRKIQPNNACKDTELVDGKCLLLPAGGALRIQFTKIDDENFFYTRSFNLTKDWQEYTVGKSKFTALKVPDMNEIKDGRYKLTEIESPSGYQKSEKIWYLTISAHQIVETDYTGQQQRILFGKTAGKEAAFPIVVPLDIENKRYDMPALPLTGSTGVFAILVIGASIMIAGLLYLRNRTKE
ncbi:SpaA isopeptide-forming pilin-related protein [Arcanobacterium hippocoleae]